MAFTREQWARDFLRALGNRNPSQQVVDWVIGWTVVETATGRGARFNLLNTTQKLPGSWSFNSVGVQNYPDYQTGIQANAVVLLRHHFAGYQALLQGLINNDAAGLNAGAYAVGLHSWCPGCYGGQGFIQKGAAHRFDLFSYGSSQPVSPPGGGGKAPNTTGAGGFTAVTTGSATSTSSASSASSASSTGIDYCSIPGVWLIDPVCLGEKTGESLKTVTNSVGHAVGNSVASAISDALKNVGNAFIHAVGAKSAVDLEQRAALIGVAIILFFVGIGIIFFAHKDTVLKVATMAAAPEAAPEEASTSEEETATKMATGMKRGRKTKPPEKDES